MIKEMDTSSPLVTIVMPVYNGDRYLHEAIESILNQTYPHFTFLIINDGSTDSTEKIILSYKDDRIQYVKNSDNLGLITTLNKGIELALGKYIMRMDADDVSLSNRVEVLVNFMENHLDVGICGSYYTIIGITADVVKYPLEHDDLKVSLLFYNPIAHPTTIWRTEPIKEHKLFFNADYIHAEDYKFWVDCLGLFKLANIPETLLKYREHEFQVSNIYNAFQKNTSQYIRCELLTKIVSDISIEECAVWEECIVSSGNFMDPRKAQNVIKRVTTGNAEISFFDQQLLERKLAKLWKNVIMELSSISIKEYLDFLKSSLTGIYPWTFKQKLFVLLKLLNNHKRA